MVYILLHIFPKNSHCKHGAAPHPFYSDNSFGKAGLVLYVRESDMRSSTKLCSRVGIWTCIPLEQHQAIHHTGSLKYYTSIQTIIAGVLKRLGISWQILNTKSPMLYDKCYFQNYSPCTLCEMRPTWHEAYIEKLLKFSQCVSLKFR